MLLFLVSVKLPKNFLREDEEESDKKLTLLDTI